LVPNLATKADRIPSVFFSLFYSSLAIAGRRWL
jgi:hypothetical protein